MKPTALPFTALRRRALLQAGAGFALACALALPSYAQAPKVLTVGSPFAPVSLDPALSGNGRAGLMVAPAYEPLVRTLPDGSFAPALATAWQVGPDHKDVTFTLRHDARFSDGEPVNAEAVKKSIEYFVGKKGPFAANLASMTGIEVLDPYKLKIKLALAQPNLVSLFDMYWLAGDIVSPKALATPDQLGTQTFGAGPYKVDPAQTISRKTYTYVRNEFYYDKSRQPWDKIVISVFEDQNSAIQAMRAGQLKLLVSDAVTANANAANLPKDIHIVSEPVQWTGLILTDRDGIVQPQLKDIRVRQAINYAIDRKLVTQALFGKFADPTDQIQGRGFMGHDPALEAVYPYDPAKAKALLAEAGYKDGFELKTAYVNNTLSQFLTQAIAGQLKKVGITVKPMEQQNIGALIAATNSKTFASLVFLTNSGVPNLAKFQTLDPKGSLNSYGTTDATLTELLAQASALPVDKAEAAWKKVYTRVVELAWFAPVSAVHACYFVHDSVKVPAIGQSIVIDLFDVGPAAKS